MRVFAKSTLVATGLGVALACSTPTEGCGCSPSYTTLAITGTFQDALGAPLANTDFVIEATPNPNPTGGYLILANARTDTAGGFVRQLVSGYPPPTFTFYARLIRSAPQDTVRVLMGPATFSHLGTPEDTLRVALRMP